MSYLLTHSTFGTLIHYFLKSDSKIQDLEHKKIKLQDTPTSIESNNINDKDKNVDEANGIEKKSEEKSTTHGMDLNSFDPRSNSSTEVISDLKGLGDNTARETPEAILKKDLNYGYYIVEWEGNDPDYPQNWPLSRKIKANALISILTFSVYVGASIYSSSTEEISRVFNVSLTKAILGLSLYILGYGLGPLILSPLTEIPTVGRTPVYIVTLSLFVIFNLVGALSKNYSTLMAMRFLTGLFGSPALSTGGASLTDMFSYAQAPFSLIAWSFGALAGPVIGPIIGGYSVMKLNWRWPLWEVEIASGISLLLLFFLLPETYAPKLLIQKADKIRKNQPPEIAKLIKTEAEIKQMHTTVSSFLFDALAKPIQIGLEPVVLFCNIYLGLSYAQFYLWFEAFPLVFVNIYDFNLGQLGLPFLGLVISCAITSAIYMYHYYKVYYKQNLKGEWGVPEDRLKIALIGGLFIPVSLFIFGWTSRASIHWIAPTIGAALYLPGTFLLFQTLMVYLPMSYPKYVASLMAINTAFRSIMASVFPLFAHRLYTVMGIGQACSMLAGISLALQPILLLIYIYGSKIRQWSKYAE